MEDVMTPIPCKSFIFLNIIRLELIYILYRNNWFSSRFCSM